MRLSTLAKLAALLPLIGLTHCDQVHALFKPKPEKPSPYAFDLVLKVSPKAEAAMKGNAEDISLDVWYYGVAAPAFRAEADQLNRIDLGAERWSYSPGTRHVHLHGGPIDTAKLAHTTDGQVQVFVSGGIGGRFDPPLICHDYIDSVRHAQQVTPVLHCEFETERYWADAAESSSQ